MDSDMMVRFFAFLLAALVANSGSYAQTTLVSPVQTITCPSGQAFTGLSAAGVFACAPVSVSCGGAAGAVLYSDGASCTGDVDHFYWDSTYTALNVLVNPASALTNKPALRVQGGDGNMGGAIQAGESQLTGTGHFVMLGYGDTAGVGYLRTDTLTPLALNVNSGGGGGLVTIGTINSALTAQPAGDNTFIVNGGGVDKWVQGWGSGYFLAGIRTNANVDPELRLYDFFTHNEQVRISGTIGADNWINGNLRLGGTTAPTETLDVTGNANVSGVYKVAGAQISCSDLDGGCTGGAGGGISELTGDVTAGPGSGAQAATLANTAVTPGSYTAADITVDAKGRITAASNGGSSVTGNGLFAQTRSATPTSTSTGLTTWVHQDSAVVSDSATGVNILAGTTTGTINARCKAAPATPYTISAMVALNAVESTNAGVGIGFYDGTNKTEIAQFLYSAGYKLAIDKWNTPTSFNAQYAGFPKLVPGLPVTIQVGDDGTTVTYKISYDGGANFTTLLSVTKTGSFLGATGYANVCFMLIGAVANTTNGTLLSWN